MQLALGIVGGIIGGPVGFMIGSMIGSLLTPGPKSEGPRLQNLHLQTSQYGQMIPIPYGTVRVPGNVIWTTDLTEHKHTSGGKGGPQVTTYTYTASFAAQVCKGPISQIRRIWADGTVIYDSSGNTPNLPTIPITIYLGTTDQLPDPTMEAVLGVGNVPGHRGTCYCVFTDWDLGTFGNRLPSLNFEVQVKAAGEQPIHRVKENHAEPYNATTMERWMARWVEGNVGIHQPIITQWTLGGDPIRVRIKNSTVVYTYDNADFHALETVVGDTGAGETDEYGDQSDTGLGNIIDPAGVHRFADGHTEKLWVWGDVHPINTGLQYAAVGSISGFIDDPTGAEIPTFGKNFGFEAGIDPSEEVCGLVCTPNQLHCFIFTRLASETGSPAASKWYDIVDGLVARSGTVLPRIVMSYGNSSQMHGTRLFDSAMFENNATYCWGVHSNLGDGGQVKVYKIDGAGNFAADSVAGTCDVLDPGFARPGLIPNEVRDNFANSCYSPAEGYCGVVNGISLVLFSRLSDVVLPTYLYEIVGDLSSRTGLAPSAYDVTALTDEVTGYTIDRQSDARTDIVPLQSAWWFDGVERAGVMTFVKRGGLAVATIDDADLAAQQPNEQPPPLLALKRMQEVDLPATVSANYIDQDTDYQVGTQYARRLVTFSQAVAKIELAIVMGAAKASQVAWTLLMSGWYERERPLTIRVPRKYWYLEPTDVINAHGYRLRLTHKRDTLGGVIEFDAVPDLASMWQQAPVSVQGSGFTPSTPTPFQPTDLLLLDIPIITDTDLPDGFYAAMSPTAETSWRGATLYKSSDGGGSYAQIASDALADVTGTASTALAPFYGGNVFDEINAVTVVLGAGGGSLSSATEAAVLNGANLCLVGDELVQFKVATALDAVTYTLGGLLRGRRGSEWAMVKHIAGERFVLLPVTDVDQALAELGQARLYKPVTTGSTLASAAAQSFTSQGVGLRPYAPVNGAGALCDPFDGSVQITWTRRTRIGGAWVDYVDVPLSEASEAYVVQIWDSTFTVCARVIDNVPSPSLIYTAAQQVTDFGATQQHIYATVGQKGAYLLGTQAPITVTGSGVADTAPLSPVPPYNSAPPPPGGGCALPVVNSTISWAAPASAFDPSAAPDHTWVVGFTTGAVVAGAGSINAAEYGGPPTQRDAVLALSPCGAPLTPASHQVGNTVSVIFYMTANPYPTVYPTLLPFTTYYYSINSLAASGMICNLSTPH